MKEKNRRRGKRMTAFLLLMAIVYCGGCGSPSMRAFRNDYEIPETISSYTRIDTAPKTDWNGQFIWDASDGGEENVWMCLRKTFELKEAPENLTAFVAADSKYWLYINGALVVFEGGVKRGPKPDGGYFDTVAIESFLKPGKNVICALVWYWGKDKSFSSEDSGKAGFLFEAGSFVSDKSWKVCRNTAFGNGPGKKPNYRLPEFNIYYDARREVGDWLSPDFDDGAWENATENGRGGAAPWGTLYPRGIPMLKDYGLRDYENAEAYTNLTFAHKKTVTLDIPYNAQCTPYLKIDAPVGKTIRIKTENTRIGAVWDTYITKDGVQEFEAPGWFNGAHISYTIPAGVTVLELKYRETGYDTAFSGNFSCEDTALNTLWQKSLRTLYVTMRDNYMDCPDRERAQWWGDVTSEMIMSMYALDPNAYLLYQKGVACMLGHVDPQTRVLPTVVPISGEFFELPVQQLAGICGFRTYYQYTGDRDFLASVYDAALDYLRLWEIGDDGLVEHRAGSWDWMDWGRHEDGIAIENAWYYYALSGMKSMAEVLGKNGEEIEAKMRRIKAGYAALWTDRGYKSKKVLRPDDRANALAVLSGLAEESQYNVITNVLTKTKHASPYMEYYVLEALCRMGRFDAANTRMLQRYGPMIRGKESTLWEFWVRAFGTGNHAWSGGPLVIMSKYYAGIEPTKAGWTEFTVKPQTDVCETLSCTVPTVTGYIRVQMNKTDGGFVLETGLPADTTALIAIPYAEGQTVTCGGEAIYVNGRFVADGPLTLQNVGDGYLTVAVRNEKAQTLRFETCS